MNDPTIPRCKHAEVAESASLLTSQLLRWLFISITINAILGVLCIILAIH